MHPTGALRSWAASGGATLLGFGPQDEVADGNRDYIRELGVWLTGFELLHVGFAGVVDDALSADADSIEQAAIQIAQLRKQVLQAEAAQAERLIVCKQHRKYAETTISVASKGSVVAVKAWGCAVAGRTLSTPTDEAPQNVSAKNARSAGDVVVRCKGLRASSYVFQYADDPTFPAGSPAPVVLPRSTCNVAGLPAGQKIYFRVAVIRRVIGQSKWSEPVQLTVR